MYCRYCGKQIDDNSIYCEHCGKQVNGINVKTKESSYNNIFDFFQKKPIWFAYIVWVCINLFCLSRSQLNEKYCILFPSKFLDDGFWNFGNYRFSDFVVYVLLIPLTTYILYNYFKTKRNIYVKIGCVVWLIWHFCAYYTSEFGRDIHHYYYSEVLDNFYPLGFSIYGTYYYPFYINSYDLRELVIYAMIIPTVLFGYLLYKEKQKSNS